MVRSRPRCLREGGRMMAQPRQLLVMACSATKRADEDFIPALERYDGSTYRVLRAFLRRSSWPSSLSVAVLSAEHGLIGGLAQIKNYDQRMTRALSEKWRADPETAETLRRWSQQHGSVSLLLGKDYHSALNPNIFEHSGIRPEKMTGGIGVKLGKLRHMLNALESQDRPGRPEAPPDRMLYFLPDWDDMLDEHYDFETDRFSAPNKADRSEVHSTRLMGADRMCDGVLVSLAQHVGASSKGVLKKFADTHEGNLKPEPMRERFGLSQDQWVFGDCGAFSYVREDEPAMSPERALAMYQLYGFDLGASVDHIPVPAIKTPNGKRVFTEQEQQGRMEITREYADQFIRLHKKRKYSFVPVGIIQGTNPETYAEQLGDYARMGYDHIAIGGLVFRSDKEIFAVMQEIDRERKRLKREDLWIHLFGVYRPKIHRDLRELGARSFDSATYFRKAWLRSGQNYLKADGESWHAAIRIPMTADPRTRKRLEASNLPLDELERLEKQALTALHEYGKRRLALEPTLEAVEAYDFLLTRSEDHGFNLMPSYRRTLEDRPWEKCSCPVCEHLGVNVVIFRGSNRNKRRGAHNTAMLYKKVVERRANSNEVLF